MVMPVLMQFKSSTSLPLCLCPCLGAYALIVTLILTLLHFLLFSLLGAQASCQER